MSSDDEQRSPEDPDQAGLPEEIDHPVHETVPHVAPGEGVVRDPVGLASRFPVTTVRSKRRPKAGIISAFVVVVLVAGVITAVVTGPSASKTPPGPLPPPVASGNLAQKVTGVPESVFESVGLPSEISNYPKKVTGLPLLMERRLPELLWVGAQYCPFCASERWSLVMALSKFGSFTGLKTSYSSPLDFAPNTPTLDFTKISYSSRLLVFRHYELASNRPATSSTGCNISGYACLQTPPTADLELFETLGGGDFPFMDFGNKVQQAGAGFGNQPLALAGLMFGKIAQLLYVPTSAVAQAEDGSANYMTAAICVMTDNEPRSACSPQIVQNAEAHEIAAGG